MSNFITNQPTTNLPIPQFDFLLQNWNAINTIFGTDHTMMTEPDVTKRGHHNQVFYNTPAAAPVPVPTGAQAASFPKASAIPISGITQEVFQNIRGLYLLSCIKAWGSSSFGGGVSDGFNVASVTPAGVGIYNVLFTTPLPTATYGILLTSSLTGPFSNGSIIGWDSKATTGFTIHTRAFAPPNVGALVEFDFLVMQT